MKKQIMFVLIALGFMAFSTLSFAESSYKINGMGVRILEGKVESINSAKDVLVVADGDIPGRHIVRASADQMSGLQIGQNVTAVSYDNGPLSLK